MPAALIALAGVALLAWSLLRIARAATPAPMVGVLPAGVEPGLGDIGLVQTGGIGARLIRLGDLIKCWRTGQRHSRYNHVVVYTGDGMIVEAQPGGAREIPATTYRRISWRTWHQDAPAGQRARIAAEAKRLAAAKVGYNWLDIGALVLEEFGWDVQSDDGRPTRIGRRIADMGQLVCSQLADLVYQLAGLVLYPGLLPGEVTPGDLDRCPLLIPAA